MLHFILDIFSIIYLAIALAVFLNFIQDAEIKFTNLKTNKVTKIIGLNRLLILIIISIFWPIILIFNKN